MNEGVPIIGGCVDDGGRDKSTPNWLHGRQRDIFPLPHLFVEHHRHGRRVCRRRAEAQRVNTVVDSLSMMYFGGGKVPRAAPVARLADAREAQRECSVSAWPTC